MAGCAALCSGNREEQRDFGVVRAECEPSFRGRQKTTNDCNFLVLRVSYSDWLRGPASRRG